MEALIDRKSVPFREWMHSNGQETARLWDAGGFFLLLNVALRRIPTGSISE